MGLSNSTRSVAFLAVVTIGLVAAGTAAGLPITELTQPSGGEILDNVEQRYEDAETVTGTADVTVTNDSETKEATVDFAFKDPDKFRFTIDRGDTPTEIGSNGSVVWAVGEEKAFAHEISTDSATEMHEHPHEFVSDENVSAELVDTTEVDGEEAYIVELTPTDADHDDVESTLWVSTEDYRVLKLTATDGTKETTVDVTETQFDVSIHDSTFEPPEDRVSVTTSETYDDFEDLQSSTDLDVPSYDEGDFESARYLTNADGAAVIQEYATDDGTVTVITATDGANHLDDLDDGTAVTVDGEDATAVEHDDRTIVFWTDDETTTGVIVEGDVDNAVAVAEEIR